ncbi:MAG TPA: hypothetical protein VNP72_01775 [Longimicrobium sp.]|nr:hypothetical protein [Longimicrobium sp.]
MRKLKMDVEELAVESFETVSSSTADPGTVDGYEVVTCAVGSCTPYPSLHNTRCGCTPVYE